MKKSTSLVSFLCLLLFLAGTSLARAAGVEVTAREKASNKVVYHATTKAGGKFTTGTLTPGSYVFEFTSQDGSGFQVALAGAKTAKAIKSKNSGLAFAVEVASANKISGQITPTQATAAAAGAKSNANVKVINGKRYVWVRGEIGSNMGGKWVPEEDAEKTDPNASRRSATEGLRRVQDLGGQGAVPGG